MATIHAMGNRDLARLDKKLGIDATYRRPTGSTLNSAGVPTVAYGDPIDVKVRSAGLSSVELSRLSQSGLGQIDAVWKMRRAYVNEVLPDDVLIISSFYYVVVQNGATLDALGLLWTIATRRRR